MKKLALAILNVILLLSCRSEKSTQVDPEYDQSSGISIKELSSTQIDNLVVLGKIWGFLKYYHKTVADGKLNWDNELFRIMPKILACSSIKERNEIFLKWTLSLGKTKLGTQINAIDSLIKCEPDLEWLKNMSDLGDKLSKRLMLIYNSERKEYNYNVEFTYNVYNPQFKNENLYSNSITDNDPGYRLLALFRYWNIIQYFYPYKNLIGEDWNNILPEFIPKLVKATNRLDYQLCILSLISWVHDTHAMLFGNDSASQTHFGTNYAPVLIRYIEDKAIVTDYLNPELGKSSGLNMGDIILKVNNRTVEEIISEKLPFISASNYPTQLSQIIRDLIRTNDTIINLTYKRSDSTISARIRCYPLQTINLERYYIKRDTCFKLLTSNVAYIYPGFIKNSYLPAIMKDIQNTKGLIIDLRCYPSDFIVFSLGEYLMPDSIAFVKFSRTSFNRPGQFQFYTTLKVGKKNPDFYKGKVIIIVNELTMSNAEYTAMAFRVAPKSIVIGSTTAGADGNTTMINLPGGIITSISGIGVYYPNGKETQRIGILPDIEVRQTIKGIVEGKDELLDKAKELINEN